MMDLKEFVDKMEVEDAFYPGKVCLGKLVRNFRDNSVYDEGYFEVKDIPQGIKSQLDDNGVLEEFYADFNYTIHAYGNNPQKPNYYYGTKKVHCE